MVSTGNILLIGLALVGGWYAYTQGWLCRLKIPQLCPPSSGGGGTYDIYDNPNTNISGFPQDTEPGGTHGAPYPAGGRLHQYPHHGYSDDGYGDDYDYESNAAVISIA